MQGLVETVLELMGVQEAGLGERNTLADMGMDSLQMVEIRTKIATAIGRPMPLEQARCAALAALHWRHDMHARQHCNRKCKFDMSRVSLVAATQALSSSLPPGRCSPEQGACAGGHAHPGASQGARVRGRRDSCQQEPAGQPCGRPEGS